MKILHIINRLSHADGGPSRSCQGLVAGLKAVGVEAALLSLKRAERPWLKGVNTFFYGEPIEDVLFDFNPDIVHIHEVWHPSLHRCAVVCRRCKVPYIISPRGMLEPWSLRQKWLKKRIARWLYQDRDMKFAAALHATAESESANLGKLGFHNSVFISPNGVTMPDSPVFRNVHHKPRKLLFVGRMHPKKGVMELIDAWSNIMPDKDDWCCELVYTVNGDSEQEYEAEVKSKVQRLGLSGQFIFTGALGDEQKWCSYASADLFVLPTYSENFGIVVAEALWAGLPVITTKGTPWRELEDRKCGWWIDVGVEPLVEALREAMSLNDRTLIEMGNLGRRLVEEEYTWSAVVTSMVKGYDNVMSKRRKYQ